MSWAEIKKALNSTVGTTGFKPLNEILDQSIITNTNKLHNIQIFTSNGSFTFKAGVGYFITAIAAGNNGYNGTTDWPANGAAGGNGGQYVFKKPFQFTTNKIADITVGTGNTIIGDFLTLLKGGGMNGGAGGAMASGSGTNAAAGASGGIELALFQKRGIGGNGGYANSGYPPNGGAGGGGAGLLGFGGGGGGGGNKYHGSYTGTRNGFGTGGDGAENGTYGSSSSAGTGGKGANGIVIIEW